VNSLPGPNKDRGDRDPQSEHRRDLGHGVDPDVRPAPLVSLDQTTETNARNLYHLPDAEGFIPFYPMATYNALQPAPRPRCSHAAIYNLRPDWPQSISRSSRA